MSGPVVVTGSDSGIGRATALALAAAGYPVGVTWHTDRDGARLTAARVRDAGVRCAMRRIDLADDPGSTVRDLAEQLGGLWGLVNCAGANHRAPSLDDDAGAFRRSIEITLTGPVLCAQAAARIMVAAGAGGRIVNVTSIHEHEPLPRAAAYSAGKAGLGMATRVLALELAPHGITVNAVAPGHIATPMTGRDGVDPATVRLPQIPLGRPGGPEEVAATIAHLVSREAGYVTGASLRVDGGLSLAAVLELQRAHEGDG
jgi:NAD(P)-dependent dehydrogenase (short-subunit alcohol dehydrogenase family)